MIPAEAHRRAESGGTGTPENALFISMHGKDEINGFVRDVAAATAGDKSKPIELICSAGGRSAPLQSHLEKQGFKNVINMREGVKGATWR